MLRVEIVQLKTVIFNMDGFDVLSDRPLEQLQLSNQNGET